MALTLRRRNTNVPGNAEFEATPLSRFNKGSVGLLWFALLLDSRELQHGIPVTDENDNRLGESTKAAQQAISQVVVSRILMASPGMGMNIFSPIKTPAVKFVNSPLAAGVVF